MATYSDIASIELRRLAELEKQAAIHGPSTEPAVLIEIAELQHKYHRTQRGSNGGTRLRDAFEYDFLMNTVAAALRRVTAIEARNTKEDGERPRRQLILNAWLGAISAGMLITIALVLVIVAQLWR